MKLISAFAAVMAATLCAFGSGRLEAATPPPDTLAPAAAYCVQHGGVVQTRIPEYNTNGGTPLVLSGHAYFCQFTSQKDGSQINVLLSTLYSRKPSLAALAYYAKVPLGSNCTGNPASCYCTLLGGSDLFGGVNLAGGGWVLKSDPTDVLEACIFPDLSSIDSWGLAYHSAGIIRGRNLGKLLRTPNPYTSPAAAKGRPFGSH